VEANLFLMNRSRKLLLIIAVAVTVGCLLLFGSSRKLPLTLTLQSTKMSEDGFHLIAIFQLSNTSHRTWTYRDSPNQMRLWRLKVKKGNEWLEGQTGGYAGMGWDNEERIKPGESRTFGILLPGDGVERRVGASLQLEGIRRDFKPLVFIRDLYYRLRRRTLDLPGQYCVWGTNTFSNRELIDRGLLTTNGVLRLAFDSDQWKAANAEVKMAMARYLASTGTLVGKTESELRELLGPPRSSQDGMISWFLGFEKLSPLGFPEKRLLMIQSDGNGRVTNVQVAILL
jgi:hypothetical protein